MKLPLSGFGSAATWEEVFVKRETNDKDIHQLSAPDAFFCLKYNFELVRYEDNQQQMHEVDNHQMHLNRIWEGVNISDFAQRNSLTHRVEEEVGMGGSSAIAGACCKMVPIGCVAWREKRQMLVFRQTLLWGEM